MAQGRLTAVSSGRLQQPEGGRSGKQADPFYLSPEWREFRDGLIKQRGRRCEDPQCERPRGPWKQIYGDHIVEIADGGPKLDPKNVLLRCPVCHGRKTRDERARRHGLVAL